MYADKLAPSHSAAPAGGSDTSLSKPGTHRRRGDGHAEALQLANDAQIAPPRILPREAKDRLANLTSNRRPTDSTGVGPTLRHQAPMPSQQRRRRDDEGPPLCPRQELARRREKLRSSATDQCLPGGSPGTG